MRKKIFFGLLGLLFALTPTSLLAADIVASGNIDSSISWQLYSDSVLTISGEGDMPYYSYSSYQPWNKYYLYIKKVIVKDGITSIGYNNFSYCRNICTVQIANTVTYIDYAFEKCSRIDSINIPTAVTYINENAFTDCTSLPVIDNCRYADTYLVAAVDKTLTNYSIKQGTRWIGKSAFASCTNMTSISLPNSLEYIGAAAFSNCSNLISISLPNKLQEIGDGAFGSCSNLSSITLSDALKTMGDRVFNYCGSLTTITIPENVENIGLRIFNGCQNLETIYYNAKSCYITPVKSSYGYGENADGFGGGYSSIIIGDKVEYIPSYFCRGRAEITDITFPQSIISIGDAAFEGTGITSLTLPNSNISIGAFAFANLAITELTIPENVRYISACAFDGCTSLRKINYNAISAHTMPIDYYTNYTSYERYNASPFTGIGSIVDVIIGKSVEYIPSYIFTTKSRYKYSSYTYAGPWGSQTPRYNNGYLSGVEYTSKGLNTVFNKITFEDGSVCKSIGHGAFAYCSDLTEIELPESLEEIDACAFIGCSGLTELVIPDNVKSIKESALYGCTGLKKLVVPATAEVATEGYTYNDTNTSTENNYLYDWAQALDSVIVPATMFDFEEAHWSVAPKNLTYIQVNSGTLTNDAFSVINRSYKNLKTLDLTATNNTDLADEAFKGCYSLEQLILPQNLQHIGYMAVADCKHLTEINIPASVVEIDDSAFENCRSIRSITFGVQPTDEPASAKLRLKASTDSQLKRIGNWAFYNCHELQELEIPEGVEEVGDGAFYGCVYMEELELPSTVRRIGDNTFALCSKMQKITVSNPEPPQIEAKTFYDVNRQIPVYVPNGAYDAYKSDEYWREFNIVDDEHPDGYVTDLQENLTGSQETLTTRKVLENGHVIILTPNGKTYNLQGAEVRGSLDETVR